jgi:N-acetylneuraminate lyase
MDIQNDNKFRLIAAPFTPFKETGEINVDVIPRLASHYKGSGVSGAFVNGTTGEYASLTIDERCELTEAWMDAGRDHDLEILVHVGDNSLANAIKLASHAYSCGADAISALAPSYFKPADIDALVDWTAAIAGEVPDCPFFYYHIPGMTGVRFSMSQYLEKADERISNLQGIKYSDIQPMDILRCLDVDPDRYEILFGCDEALLTGLSLGASGAVGSTYNFMAPLYLKLIKAFEQGDLVKARKLQTQSIQIVDQLAGYQFLPAAKTLMRLYDIDCGKVRAPLTRMSSAEAEAMLARLKPQVNKLTQ